MHTSHRLGSALIVVALGTAAVTAAEPLRIAKLQRFAPFAFQDLAGKTWTEADFLGRVTVIEIWSSWCGPCVKNLPEVRKLHERLKGDPSTRFVSIAEDRSPERLQALFARSPGSSFPVLVAGEGIEPQTLPTTVILDREGYVREIRLGLGPGWVEDTLITAEAVKKRLPVRFLR